MPAPFKIIIRLSLAIFLFLVTIALPGVAIAENQDGIKTIVVMGSGKIQKENVALARMEAIENSLIAAVDSVAIEVLPPESIINNFQSFNEILYDQTGNFIQGYKVLTEFSSENIYRVMIEATVSINSLKKILSNAGIVLDKKALPKILLLVSEKNSEDILPKYWWGRNPNVGEAYSANALMETLQTNGFAVVDHRHLLQDTSIEERYDKPDLNNQEAIELGLILQTDVIIVGASVSDKTTNIMGDNVRSFKGVISARAIRTDTGVEMGSTTQTIVTANTDEIAGNRDALFQAGTVAGQKLASQIVSFWQKETQTGNIIEIIIEGTDNLTNFVKFRRVIHDIPGVKHLQMKEMTLNQATVIVDFQGTPEDLASALMLKALDTIGINIYEISPNHLRIELISS
jgi:hypothetical protein